MSWLGDGGTGAEDGLAAGLLTNIRFDPKNSESYYNWHETRGISRAALQAIYANPKSKPADLERLYRKAGINIRDLRDMLDESADSTTLEAVFAENKKKFGPAGTKRSLARPLKLVVSLALAIAALFLLVIPFLKSCQ